MSKIKILVTPLDRAGVSYFRLVNPAIQLSKLYPEDFFVDIVYDLIDWDDVNFLKQYQIVFFNRDLQSNKYTTVDILEKLYRLGIKSVLDIDDYWDLPEQHPMHFIVKDEKFAKQTVASIMMADYVTTTTRLFADKIKELNKNVYVFPNAINPEEKNFIPNAIESEKIRIGWLGGSCYDDKTEVMTKNGFKFFKQLEEEDLIATLNPNTSNIEYHKPIHYIKKKFIGNLITGINSLLDFAVTPNHNMYVKPLNGDSYDLIKAEDINSKNFYFKRSHNQENTNTDQVLLETAKLYLLWALIGEIDLINKDKIVFKLRKNKTDLIEVLEDILKKNKYKPEYDFIKDEVFIIDSELSKILLPLSQKKYNRFIPNQYKLSENVLLDLCILFCGSEDHSGHVRINVSSKKLADDIHHIAFLCGKAAITKSFLYPKPFFEVSYHIKTQKDVLLNASEQSLISYNNYVYCVEVPNHIIYVRRNGKSYWCGNSHYHDLKYLDILFNQLNGNNSVQTTLCGFDIRGNQTFIDQFGRKVQIPIKPHETIWAEYDKIFTNNYKNITDKNYVNHLLKYKEERYPGEENSEYVRRWTKNIPTYASNYNFIDIVLAPLDRHLFNEVKSQLKVIEAGFHKKALVAENFGPYKIDIIVGKNGLLVDSIKNKSNWYNQIKRLIDNPSMREDMGEELYETVKEKYNLIRVTHDRAHFFKNILQ